MDFFQDFSRFFNFSKKYFFIYGSIEKIFFEKVENFSEHQDRSEISWRIEWEHSQPLKITPGIHLEKKIHLFSSKCFWEGTTLWNPLYSTKRNSATSEPSRRRRRPRQHAEELNWRSAAGHQPTPPGESIALPKSESADPGESDGNHLKELKII